MIFQEKLDFPLESNEGKMLLSAIAILTTLSKEDIDSGRFGKLSNSYSVLKEIVKLANKKYYEEEYNQHLKSTQRDKKIQEIIEK